MKLDENGRIDIYVITDPSVRPEIIGPRFLFFLVVLQRRRAVILLLFSSSTAPSQTVRPTLASTAA